MKKIILVGYMGSGKTEIGRLLSKNTQIPYFDLDFLIEEETKQTISELFSNKGEIYFRKIEHEVFKTKINENTSYILSLGGGTPCYANNHLLLQHENIHSVYLKANINTLTNRLKYNKSKRPIISDLNENELQEFIAKHLFDRSYYYNQCKYTITVNDKTPTEIVNEIEKLLF